MEARSYWDFLNHMMDQTKMQWRCFMIQNNGIAQMNMFKFVSLWLEKVRRPARSSNHSPATTRGYIWSRCQIDLSSSGSSDETKSNLVKVQLLQKPIAGIDRIKIVIIQHYFNVFNYI